MSATIQVSRNFTTLTDLANPTPDEMREIGLLLRERIMRRTIQGQDADGGSFPPYSPEYAKRKGEALGGGGVVNLQVSGNMLNHMGVTSVEVEDGVGKVTLGWNQ